jgi:hypothetical protein
MAVDEFLDVSLEAGLRPAALIVTAGNVRRLVHERDEPTAAEHVDVAALAAYVGDERAVAATDDRDEWCDMELVPDPCFVVHG